MHKSLLQHAGSPIRPAIRDLQPNGIALVSGAALGEPDVIALWFGESDLVTPAFIREAAKKALDDELRGKVTALIEEFKARFVAETPATAHA